MENNITVKWTEPCKVSAMLIEDRLGLTLRAVYCSIMRSSDGKYYNSDAGDFLPYDSYSKFTLTEPDSTNSPGLYSVSPYAGTWGQLEYMDDGGITKSNMVIHVWEESDAVVVAEEYYNVFVLPQFTPADVWYWRETLIDEAVSAGTKRLVPASTEAWKGSIPTVEYNDISSSNRELERFRVVMKSLDRTREGRLE